MAHARIEVLLFDLGGVLIDIHGERVLEHWARCAGVGADILRSRFEIDEAYREHERGERDACGYFAALRDRLGIAISDEDFLTGWNAMLGDEKPDVRTLLDRAARAYPLYLFSNTNAAHHAVWSRTLGSLLQRFQKQFVSSEIRLRKPEPQAFLHVAEAMATAPENVLFFDDVLENIHGARAVGMQAVHVRSSQDIADALAQLMP